MPAWVVAISLTAATGTLLDVPISLPFYTAVVSGAAAVYLSERLTPAPEDPFTHPARVAWLQHHRPLLLGLAVGWGVTGLSAAAYLRPATTGMGLILGVTAAAYAWPIVAGRRLKTIRRLKITLIACVWSGATVLLPLVEARRDIGSVALTLFVMRALTVAANALVHDWLDREGDARGGVITVPQRWTWRQVRGTGWSLLGASGGLAVALFPALGPLILVDGAGLVLLAWALRRPGSDPTAYGALLDGLVAWPLVTAAVGWLAGLR